ncbi:UDP-N-acetylglucosamine 2-epimerase [Protaetiibacter intestinalis]|uniref:UDP-N-acetylglucosamine 2-epimerase domain-containing protein n=1 Tax=Protaetiibacter intestinalis TaxID=2419774 RepID=A0A387B3Z7_9MICO|nr:UDP-N-acetylglucosamine 2-epimerase [Protaetiibacter intestinalis]AYF98354.1 hypothetical protein D7I47_08855 [Protaetiibacter intestinalis]
MIIFVYGTTAEAIKIAPVARRLAARGIAFQQWLTMQHTDSLREILPTLGLPQPDRIIADGNRGKPLKTKGDVVHWLWAVVRWVARNARTLRSELPDDTVIVVHGDTMTTVVGAWLARRIRVPSAHIEAGLRSGNWRHPFPEELDRRIVGHLATIHYPPSDEAAEHLRGRDNVVNTHRNTVVDAVLDQGEDATVGEPYGVVLLHRFEFISNPALVDETIGTIAEHAAVPLRLMVDAYSEGALREALDRHDKRGVFQPQPKLRHQEFIGLLKGAEFIVTDSGGIQAEAALLGVPTLIHRKATEQHEGIGANITLSQWDQSVVTRFLEEYEHHRVPLQVPEISPSDIIVEDLISRGFART